MKNLQDLTSQVAQTMDTLLPKNVRCVIVLVDTDTQNVASVSDLSDEEAKALLEEGLSALEDADYSGKIEIKPHN